MSLVSPTPMLNYFGYLFDGANWHLSGDSSIPERLAQHVGYTLAALAIGALIALPLGLLIGHTNRGAFIAIGLGNLGRSLPTFGLVLLLVTFLGVYIWPVLLALIVLAIPPILAQTYAGIRSVDPCRRRRGGRHGDAAPAGAVPGRGADGAAPDHRWPAQRAPAGHRDRHHRGVRQLRWPRSAADRRAEPQPVRPGPGRRHHGRRARDHSRLRQRRRRAGRGLPRCPGAAAAVARGAPGPLSAPSPPAEESPVSASR